MEATIDMRGEPPETTTIKTPRGASDPATRDSSRPSAPPRVAAPHDGNDDAGRFEDLTCDLSAEPIAAAVRFHRAEGIVDPNPTLESPPPPALRKVGLPFGPPVASQRSSTVQRAAPPAIRRAPARSASTAAPRAPALKETVQARERTGLIEQPQLVAPGVATETPPPAQAGDADREGDAPIGQLLKGRYELQVLLGRGGMASVYKAIDHDRTRLGVADRFVAVKVVQESASRPASPAALIQEFQSAQRLSHPNVINVYDIDRDGDTTFYSMELLSGARLSQLMRRVDGTALPRRYALAIIRDIGAAVSHAHARGVVHADLKPSNVMITQEGEVRVLDFGGASMPPREPWVSVGDADDAYHHATPAYASCEQLERRRADPRDDIYALACIAYLLLTGRHPFDYLSSLVARSRHLQAQRPPHVSRRQWRALREGLNWIRADRPSSLENWLSEFGLAAAAPKLPPLHDLTAAAQTEVPWARRMVVGATVIAAVAIGWTLLSNADIDWHRNLNLRNTLRAVEPDRSGAAQPPPAASASAAVPPQPAARTPAPAPRAAAPLPASSPSLATPESAAAQAPVAAVAPVATAREEIAPHVEFASQSYTVRAADPAARIVVQRNGNSRGDLNFIWWTEADSAAPDVDYASLGARTEHLAGGEDRMTVYVPIISNPLRHKSTQFHVVLADAASHRGNGGSPDTRATVTIEAD